MPPPSTPDPSAQIPSEPVDADWSRLLELFRVPGRPGLYVLGCFARRVTFYAQQVRALNLIDVLCKNGEVQEGSSIGIVGAGVAGVTAAAAAARRGLKVTLFEKDRDRDARTIVLPRQRLSDERAVHPLVYDWPEPSAPLDEQQAGLPLMDWTADSAAKVVKALAALYDAEAVDGAITLRQAELREEMIRLEDGAVWIDLPSQPALRFDVVILAVGFGEETGQSYWVNDGLASKHGEWLVSGTGDGGLTDLMRLCIDKFRHDEVVAMFGERGQDAGRRLLDADALDAPARTARYRGVAREIVELLSSNGLALRLRENVQVWLAGSEDQLFSPGASLLNRLIVAYLLERQAFRLIPHSTAATQPLPNNRTRVVFTDDRQTLAPVDDPDYPSEFDGVVVRHGPLSSLGANFPKLLSRCRSLKRKWDEMPVAADPTRRPFWKIGDFDPGSMPPLDVAEGRFVVVVAGPAADDDVALAQLAESALSRADEPGRLLPRVVAVDPETDLATVHAYRRLVRALCRCEVAIFDITDKRPATMLLLGIRSVVRRGITLSTVRIEQTVDAMPEPFDVPALPFNIREASVIARRGDNNAFIEALKNAIVEGHNQMRLLAGEYQDLPAYDAVRKLGPLPENHRPVPPKQGVLVLSSYEKNYLKGLQGQIVASALGTALPSKDYRWLRIVQSPSPQLASQKLYAAIRQSQMCVFDWTGWRPNLFFELGVRLATSPTPPVNIGYREALAETGPERRVMLDLFMPFAYDKTNQNSGLVTLLRAHVAAIESGAPTPGLSSLSPAFTFSEAQRWTDVAAESPLPVDAALEREAAALVGPDPRMYAEVPLLYKGNERLRREAQMAALDRWIAAWYFLDRRHRIAARVRSSATLPQDAPAQRWIKLATQIQTMLESSPKGYERIKRDVDRVVTMCVDKS